MVRITKISPTKCKNPSHLVKSKLLFGFFVAGKAQTMMAAPLKLKKKILFCVSLKI
jgi:hypothetical protein